jgi:hypothetical protein
MTQERLRDSGIDCPIITGGGTVSKPAKRVHVYQGRLGTAPRRQITVVNNGAEQGTFRFELEGGVHNEIQVRTIIASKQKRRSHLGTQMAGFIHCALESDKCLLNRIAGLHRSRDHFCLWTVIICRMRTRKSSSRASLFIPR